MDYQSIILQRLQSELFAVVILIAGISALIISLKGLIIFFRKPKTVKHKKKDFISYVLIFIIAIILIVHFVADFGIIFVQMALDYYNNDFSTYTGMIFDSKSANGITNTNIEIHNSVFYLSRKNEDTLENYRGKYCEIVYGTRSKYIVDYNIIN